MPKDTELVPGDIWRLIKFEALWAAIPFLLLLVLSSLISLFTNFEFLWRVEEMTVVGGEVTSKAIRGDILPPILVTQSLALLIITLFLRRHGIPGLSIGLCKPPDLRIALLLVVVASPIMALGAEFLMSHILPVFEDAGISDFRSKLFECIFNSARAEGLFGIGALLFFAGFMAPLVEEIFFRGFLQTAFQNRYGFRIGALISSIAFASIHIDPTTMIVFFLMGLLLSWLYRVTGSLLTPILVHAANNTFWTILALAGVEKIF